MLTEKHYATVGLLDLTADHARAILPDSNTHVRHASISGVAKYVENEANNQAVAELMAAGFTESQARQIVANAKKSPEEVAREAAREAAPYVSSAVNDEAKKRLVSVGFTETEAERMVASGKNVDAIVSSLEAIGSARLNDMVVNELVEKGGVDENTARLLAATGGDPKKLLAIAKDPKRVAALIKGIDERLRKEGIDISQRIKDGFGVSDADMKTAGVIYKAASAAYDVFEGIDAFMRAGDSRSYIASRWDERSLSDGSFNELAQAIDDMASQSEAMRQEKTAAYKAAASKISSGLAAGAAFIPVAGPAIGVAIVIVNKLLDYFGAYDAGSDDNDPKYKDRAAEIARKIWEEWQLVPPTFDGRYFSLRHYGDVCQTIYDQLQASESERAWLGDFFSLLNHAYTQTLGKESPIINDLTILNWLPIAYSDWMGGAQFVDSPDLLVGGPGQEDRDSSQTYFFNNRTATPQARDLLNAVPAGIGMGFSILPLDNTKLPRGAEIQNLICDRIAATIATVMAVAYGKPVEPLVQTAVGSSRICIERYSWAPEMAARRLRDTFLATLEVAKATPDLDVPKYLSFTRASAVSDVANPLMNSALTSIRSKF